MDVEKLMSRPVFICRPNDTLNRVAQIMWEHDCGCVPVINSHGEGIGMITDRDICMAAYTQGKPLDQITVETARSRELTSVHPMDTVEHAEALMRKRQIRRVPVVNDQGVIVGVVSLNDVARHVVRSGHKPNGLSAEHVAQTLGEICTPRALNAGRGVPLI